MADAARESYGQSTVASRSRPTTCVPVIPTPSATVPVAVTGLVMPRIVRSPSISAARSSATRISVYLKATSVSQPR